MKKERALFWFEVLCLIAFIAGCGGKGGGSAPDPGAKAIVAFSFISPAATGTIDENAKTIAVTVPYGTKVAELAATFTTSGASVMVGSTVQVSGTTPNDFTSPVAYMVTALDGTTATYTVTVTVAASSAAGAIRLPQTGQTECYDSLGAVINCANTGQNGALQTGVAWPYPRFTTNADISVTDNLTGLVWAPNGNVMPTRDPGWDTDGTTDDGMVTWQHALDYVTKLNAENYLGYKDWRLPNRRELKSLTNYSQPITAQWLTTQGFSNAQGGFYWSSTSYASEAHRKWKVAMDKGVVSNDYQTSFLYVWPVRGGQGAGAAANVPKTGQASCYNINGTIMACLNTGQDGELQTGVAWPIPRFTTNADISVTDNLTGLVWAPNGNIMPTRDSGWDTDGPNDGKVTWQHALDYVAMLNRERYLGYNDWRLPDIYALESLLNAGQANTATWLNTQGFSNAQSYNYWSSTSNVNPATGAWIVAMLDASVYSFTKTNPGYVWPVRAGQ